MSEKTNLLISLRKLDELSEEIIKEVDILDLKDPLNGSIGSWDLQDIKTAVSRFKNKIEISATLGDILINKEFIIKLKQFDELSLNYIKFGLLSVELNNLFDKIKFLKESKYKTKLVCVVFVDLFDHLKLVYERLDLFDACGIKYIMLDTYKKNNGDLLNFCNISNLNKFITKCKNLDIKIGLAGSLKENQIPELMKLEPDILGFRSAICKFNKRMSEVDLKKIKKISSHFNLCNNNAIETAGACKEASLLSLDLFKNSLK